MALNFEREGGDLSRPIEKVDILVERGEGNVRLDRFLKKRLPWRSRSYLQGLIRLGRIVVNGTVQRTSWKVREGDRICVWIDRLRYKGPPCCHIPIRIVYEDDSLIALNKQPGLVVHPVSRYASGTLINVLHHHFRNTFDPARDVVPMLVHRLDMNTSGLILIAKNERMKASLSRQFEGKWVEKVYLAIVEGRLAEERGRIELPIGPAQNAPIRIQMGVRPDIGAPARTDYEAMMAFEEFSLVRLLPKTGKTHQLRVHLSAVGNPILCDHIYSARKEICASELRGKEPLPGEEPVLNRNALHSSTLTFFHPVLQKEMTLEAPLWEDMKAVISILRGEIKGLDVAK